MISLGELPAKALQYENGSDNKSDGAGFTSWLSCTLENHRKACDANMEARLAALEAVVVKHILDLKRVLNDEDAQDEMALYGESEEYTVRDVLSGKNVPGANFNELRTVAPSAASAYSCPAQSGVNLKPSMGDDTLADNAERQVSEESPSTPRRGLKNKVHERLSLISHKLCSMNQEVGSHKKQAAINDVFMHQDEWDEYHSSIEGSLLGKAVGSTSFDVLVAIAIIASAVVMFAELQYYGDKARVSLGMQDEVTWDNAPTYFPILEHAFNIIFLIELLARIITMKKAFLKDGFAMLDCVLVTSTSIHLYILSPMNIKTGARSSVFRLIRLTRLVRVLRFVRVMKLCSELRVLVNTCVSCIQALVWSMIFLGVIMMSCALFLTQLIHETIVDTNMDMEIRKWCYRYYGSAVLSIYTLFEITLAGCWPNYFRPLVEKVSAAYSILAFFYISMVVFALIRIITALFLKETLRVASADAQSVINEQARKKKDSLKKLHKVFRAMDVHGDGKISIQDFHRVVTHPTIQSMMSELGMELHDTQMLFRLLDDGDGFVTYDEFVQGTIRLRGQAREIDVIAILHSQDKEKEMLRALLEHVDVVNTKLDKALHRRRGSLGYGTSETPQPPSS